VYTVVDGHQEILTLRNGVLIFLFFENGRKAAHQFLFFYEIDEQEAEPALLLLCCLLTSFTNFHKEGTGNAAYQHLVLPEELKE
jgi:hypothetical protein